MTRDQSATQFNYFSAIWKGDRLPNGAREPEMWIGIAILFEKEEWEKKKLGISFWSSEQENEMRCGCVLFRQHREPLIIRLFILLLKSVNAGYTHRAAHMGEEQRDLGCVIQKWNGSSNYPCDCVYLPNYDWSLQKKTKWCILFAC